MLKDPRWDKEPTLASFALFVASKPKNEGYDWSNCERCAVGQYLASIGKRIPLSEWGGDIGAMNRLAHGNRGVSIRPDLWTFGQLANRILAHQMAETA